MALKVRRLSHAIGASIEGVDLAKPIDDSVMREIRKVWLDHLVIVFPGQEITPRHQAELGRHFGTLDTHRATNSSEYQTPEDPAVWIVTNRDVNGKPSETRDIGRLWHSDHCFTTKPTMATMLYCVEVPEVGGTTMFTNLYMAYEALSDGMKKLIDTLEAVHSWSHYIRTNPYIKQRNSDQVARHDKESPAVAHPVVRVNPETGRKALYINEGFTSHLAGMTREESHGLLSYLIEHSTKPEFTYRHAWTPKECLMWDNRCTAHLAVKDFEHGVGGHRHMHRVTVEGEPQGRIYSEAA